MRKKGFILLFFLIGIFAFLLSYKNLHAQQNPGIDLTVSPPLIELNAKPGTVIKEKFRVRNNLSQSVELTISARKLTSSKETGEPVPDSTTSNDESLAWVKFDPPSFTALPKEWKDVSFTIDIPSTAAYGYYYVFRIGPKDEGKLSGVGARLKGEVLIVTLLNVKKDGARAEGSVVEFKPNAQITEYLPVEFKAIIANKGNIHIRPRGNIFIRSNGNKKDVAILEINQGLATVLPNGTRSFISEWRDGFLVKESVIEDGKAKLDNKGNPVNKIVINWNKLTSFRIGPYTATLLMVFDDGKRDVTLEGTTSFWVIPYTAIGIITVTLIALFIIIRFLLKWYIRRELRKQRGLR